MSLFDDVFYHLGYIPKEEWYLKSIPKPYQEEIKRDLDDWVKIKEPNQWFDKGFVIRKKLERMQDSYKLRGPVEEATKSYIVRGASDLFGYRPAGARLWNYFANPFGVFGYIAEHYSPARICVDLIRTEVESDGFLLKGAEGVSEEELLDVYKQIIQLNLEEIRLELIAHLEFYGNGWLLPHMRKKKLLELEIMYPNKLMPAFNRTTEEIVKWEYEMGRIRRVYMKDELLHVQLPSVTGKKLGSPPLVSAVTDIEAALSASAFNNLVFQKGGLLSTLVSLKNPDNGPLNAAPGNEWIDFWQSKFDSQFAGTKGANGVVFMNNVEGVHQLSSLSKMDTAWLDGLDHTSKTVAYLLGMPSEKIGINRSSALQYQAALIEDILNAQFDKTINRLTNRVDKFLNRKVLNGILGISNIKIVSSGRYGALTKAAAETIKLLAQAGLIITVNEARERILGWEPLPPGDPRGRTVLNIDPTNKDPEGLPNQLGEEFPDPDLLVEDLYADEEKKFITIHVGGKNSGRIFTKN